MDNSELVDNVRALIRELTQARATIESLRRELDERNSIDDICTLRDVLNEAHAMIVTLTDAQR